MKLIALKTFRNVGHRIQVENPTNPNQIDKGCLFDIGAAADLKALRKEDRELAELATRLLMAKVASEPSPEIIAELEAENAADRKREARAVQADETARLENVGAIVAALGLAAKKLQK